MPLPEIETFLRRLLTDPEWSDYFRREPEAALAETALDLSERWAAAEALRDSDLDGSDFLPIFRTRLALMGIAIGEPPPDARVFHARDDAAP